MNSITNVYLKNQIQTNSPGKLVLMLYDGLKRFTNQGIKAIEAGDVEKANSCLVRAQDILMELIAGLNDEAGEITRNLHALYEYMHYQLIQANLKKETKPALEVIKMAGELADTWNQMLKEKDKNIVPVKEPRMMAMGR